MKQREVESNIIVAVPKMRRPRPSKQPAVSSGIPGQYTSTSLKSHIFHYLSMLSRFAHNFLNENIIDKTLRKNAPVVMSLSPVLQPSETLRKLIGEKYYTLQLRPASEIARVLAYWVESYHNSITQAPRQGLPQSFVLSWSFFTPTRYPITLRSAIISAHDTVSMSRMLERALIESRHRESGEITALNLLWLIRSKFQHIFSQNIFFVAHIQVCKRR